MQRYLVGGAVRDELLGRSVKERDWVVVGETPESMMALGFKPVGKDFPVFLHPETREEHALARTERKTAKGYHGFEVDASAHVTLEQDLLRRDLTVNAMARDEHGRLIDPYNGAGDLRRRVLRHVSPAFSEDPVRILRVARFAARYAPLGFQVAPETMDLMRRMTVDGEVDALVQERVWAELVRALAEPAPSRFFTALRECDALERLLPEVDRLFGVPQPPKHHPEVDTGMHTLMVIDMAARLSENAAVVFAALTHDLGKALTDPDKWPSHHGHEELGLRALATLCDRLRVPNAFRKLAEKVMRYHGLAHRAQELRSSTLVDLFSALDLYRQPQVLTPFLLACEADSRGRAGFESRNYDQAEFLLAVFAASQAVEARSLVAEGYAGEELGKRLRERRIAAIKVRRKELDAGAASMPL